MNKKLVARALSLALLAGFPAGCGKETPANPTPSLPSPNPTPSAAPTPTPTPAPTPTPTPPPSATGYRAVVSLFPNQMECKTGVKRPNPPNPFKVGCSIEVRLDIVDRHGEGVSDQKTGSDVTWVIEEGKSIITLPWDENVFRRWMTAKAAGDYRIVATLRLKKTHEPLVGILEGEILP